MKLYAHWWNNLKGPVRLPWSMFLPYALVTMLDQLFGIGKRTLTSLNALLPALLGITICTFALWGLLSLAKLIFLRFSFFNRHPVFLLTTFLSSTVISVVVKEIITILGSGDGATNKNIDVFDQIVFGFILLTSVYLIDKSIRQYSTSVSKVLEVEAQLKQAQVQSGIALLEDKAKIVEQTKHSMFKLMESLSVANPELASQALSDASENVVRPLSHFLMDDKSEVVVPKVGVAPKPGWAQVFSKVTSAPVISPFLIAFVCTLFFSRLGSKAPSPDQIPNPQGLSVSADLVSIEKFFLQVFGTFLIFWLGTKLVNWLIQTWLPIKRPALFWWPAQVAAALILALGGRYVLLAYVSLPWVGPRPSEVLLDWTVFLIPVILGMAVSFLFQVIISRNGLVLATLKSRRDQLKFDLARLNEQLWKQRSELAKTLHGSLRAALTAGSIQLHNAKGTAAQIQEVVTDVKSKLGDIVRNLDHAIAMDFDSELDLIIRTWRDACHIELSSSLEVRARIQKDATCQPALIDLIGEACSNAVIHGHATKVTIELVAEPGNLLSLVVADNGQAEQVERPEGLGKRLFDQVCTSWSLTRTPEGTVLKAKLPLL